MLLILAQAARITPNGPQIVRIVKTLRIFKLLRLLKTFRIPYCQPNQEPPTEREQSVEVKPFVFVTGDHRESASLEGAMRAGTRCGQVVSAALSPLMLAKSRDIVADYAKSVGVDLSVPPFEPSASKLDKKLKV